MKLSIFTIFDSKANAYLSPFFMPNAEIATRAIVNHLFDEEHDFHKFSADFDLFQIGAFSDDTGKIEPHTPKHLANLLQLKAQATAYFEHTATEEHFAAETSQESPSNV